MSDSQPNPERDEDAPDPSPAEPLSGSPEQGAQDPAAFPDESQGADDGAPSATAAQAPTDGRPARAMRLVRGRTALWAAVAVLCVAAGIVGSVLGAHAVVHADGAKSRRAFQRTSTTIASALKLAIRHEEQLGVSASTFFADHPHATPAEFATWTSWARTVRRYPELDALGFLTLLHASPARLLSRDAGLSAYTPLAAGRRRALAVETPVYRGNVTPRSVLGRRAAAVGWLREVFIPGVVLREVLADQPGYALRLRYRRGSANVAFTRGAPLADAQSTTIRLRGGWIVKSFGPPVNSGISADGNALALLIGGSLLSVLLGVLVFMLGSRLPRTRLPQAPPPAPAAPKPPELPDADLYDALTGLPNRSLTLDRAERMVARATRDSGMLAGALFVDIDRLKDVNEKLGPAAGDQLLRIVGERLHDVVRTHDTVGRLGGDEFVVLVESAARGIRLDSLAQRMIAALHQPVELDDFGPSFVLTASIGVAFGRYETYEDMLRDARLALASAKAAGKDRYTLFNANMRTVIEGRAVLEAELNTALSEQQFFLLYQPIYDLSTQRVAGVEALIRWQHPTQGVLAPDDFIPLAEETGLIVPIGRWALEEACNRAAAWSVAGHRVGVAVKVSATQLKRQGFVTDVRRALQQSGIEPALLTLELAETAVMREVESSAERLRELKSLGVSVAIDDFGGSGYAYHSDLRQLPLDCLRVDRGSLAASEDEDYRSWLLESILLVGRDLSLTVIATGIETAEQMASLQALGFTMAQGFLLGKPTPLGDLEGLFVAGFPAAHAISTSPALTSPALANLAQAGPAPAGPVQGQAGSIPAGPVQGQAGSIPAGPVQGQAGSIPAGPVQGQAGSAPATPAQGQAGPAQVGAAQSDPAESRPAQSTPPASQPFDPEPRG
jgi:diguanylate cyclase (GGDEF)-like protein